MNSFSTKSAKFNSSYGSQRLNKVDEHAELAEERTETTAAMAKEKEIEANLRKEQWKRNEKEQRFRDKYRWAEKQHKLRSGKCEGYSFSSIKAGLKRQDFLDTLNWSPANNAKVVQQPTLLANLVQQLLSTASNPTAGVVTVSESTEDDHSETSKSIDGHMNENDWQLATSRKVSQLRLRGPNTISARMNVDSFIDSALSEPLGIITDTAEDVTLTDLQSPKLIESRFGWSKVRRAIVAPSVSAKISPLKLSNGTQSGTSSPLKGLSRASTASSLHGDKIVNSANADGRPNSSTGRPPLCFQVPESATHIRPKSAIVIPTANTRSILTPVNEFVAVVRQEMARPKSSHGAAQNKTPKAAKLALPERPKTATFRITDTPAINQQAERDMVEAMQSLHSLLAGEEVYERAEQRKQDAQIYDHYSGLLYHDPGRKTTWQGVDELLSPPPYLHQPTEEELEDEANAVIVRTDTRWAGKTLNSHRPWSPTPESMGMKYLNARGRGTRGSIQMQFGMSGIPKRSNQDGGLNDATVIKSSTMLDASVEIVEVCDVPLSRPETPSRDILPQIDTKSPYGTNHAASDRYSSMRSMSGLTETVPSRQSSILIFSPQRAQSKLGTAEPTRAATPPLPTESPAKGRPATASPNTSHRRPHSKNKQRDRPSSALDAQSSEVSTNPRTRPVRDATMSNSSSIVQENSLMSMGSQAHKTRSTMGTRASSASSRRTPLLINLVTRRPPGAAIQQGQIY